MRIVLEGLRGEVTITELCRREGIHPNMYYKWSKDFLEAGKARPVGDARRAADSQEVKEMRSENEQLKAMVAELSPTSHNRLIAGSNPAGPTSQFTIEDFQFWIMPR